MQRDANDINARIREVLTWLESFGRTNDAAETAHERKMIAPIIKEKTKLVSGPSVTSFVASGGAELGVQMISEILPVSGVELVGPLPPDLQKFTPFAAAVATRTASGDAGKELIRFLAGPEASAVITRRGMQPRLDFHMTERKEIPARR